MSALALRTLRVRRMPGIGDGGFELSELSPGLNVVYGPNASGKTTTAGAIEALFWPRAAPEHAWLSARLGMAGSEWSVDLDGGKARWQRDGIDGPAAVHPADEARDRYRISLHELLAAEDMGFALAIARESAGGFDLAAAARALDPRTSASRCTREVAALRDAKVRLEEASAGQEALFAEERRLRDLEERLARREALSTRIRLLDKAVEHARAREAAAQALAALAPFDPRMERLHGDEADRLRSIAEKLDSARAEALGAEHDEQRARSVIAACGLPEAGLPPDVLPALKHELEALREQERQVAAQEQARVGAEARRERERTAIGVAIDSTRLRELSVAGIGALAGFAREAEELAAHRVAMESELAQLSRSDGPARSLESMERGVWLLRQWLRSAPAGEDRARRLRTLATIAALALVAACLGLTLVHPLLAASAICGVVLLVLIARVGGEPDARPVHQADFTKLGFAAPAAWSYDAVERRLSELETEAASARREADLARRRREIAARLEALEPREREIRARQRSITEHLGVQPTMPVGSLVWLVERIGRWHDAHADAEGLTAELARARVQLAARLKRARSRVAPYTAGTNDDVAALAGALEDLEQRQKRFDGALHQLEAARAKRTSAGRAIRSLEEEHADLLARLGLAAGDEAVVDAWCAARVAYLSARQEERRTAALHAAEAERLSGMDGFDASLLVEDEGVLADRAARTRQDAAELDRLHDEATEIRARIVDAKRLHAVEEALADVARCEDDLRAARRRDVRSVVAAALVDFVQGVTRDQHLPQVFHRARELFVRITHGRFRLDFDDGQPPAFRAFDTTTGIGHPLEELSSATRIQLLMAVRLAFVETQEQGAQLPLLFDETLGNSDDARAAAIMDALLELVAGGRQVFYFTAQPDEVGKWRGLVAERDGIAAAFLDLGKVRSLAHRLELPGLRVVGAPEWAFPLPGGMSHAEYREVLAVPPLDAFAPVDTVHLWYLVDETEALYRLLARLRAERWGALRSLVEYGGRALVDPNLYARTMAMARALETALGLWRIGRGRPVDRAVLEASGAITESFLDAVDELCRSCGGDARQLLDALDRREVKGFRTAARASLQEYLERNGYLDERDAVSADVLRVRMMASVADDIDRGVIGVDRLDWLLARLDDSLSHAIQAA